MRRGAAVVLVAVALLAAAGCGGASQDDVEMLEARVAELEAQVERLADETSAVRTLEGRLGEIESFVNELRERFPDLGELVRLLEGLGALLP